MKNEPDAAEGMQAQQNAVWIKTKIILIHSACVKKRRGDSANSVKTLRCLGEQKAVDMLINILYILRKKNAFFYVNSIQCTEDKCGLCVSQSGSESLMPQDDGSSLALYTVTSCLGRMFFYIFTHEFVQSRVSETILNPVAHSEVDDCGRTDSSGVGCTNRLTQI